MNKKAVIFLITITSIIFSSLFQLFDAEACTRMFWNTNGKVMLVGRNLDLDLDDKPVFYVFPRGLSKNGGDDQNPATWISRYGSVVVTHLDTPTFSAEGVNEAGLAFHSLYLTPTKYESRDYSRPGVNMGRYGIYLLDNAATVSEALRLIYQIQLVPEWIHGKVWPQHYAIEDKMGDSAIIEFVGGKMNVYHGSEYTVLTNDPTLDQHILNLWNYQYFGGDLPLPGDLNPMSRFVRASAFLSSLNAAITDQEIKPDPVSSMFNAIRAMTEPFGAVQFLPSLGNTPIPAWPTLWTLVYDLTNKKIYFSHNLARNNYRIEMQKLNFEKGSPMLTMKADKRGLSGEASRYFRSK